MPNINPRKITSKNVALTQNVLTKCANPAGSRKLLAVQNANATNFSCYFANIPLAPSFDGTPQYVILDDGAGAGLVANATLLASTTGTIKARIRLDAVGTTARTIFSLSDADANEYMALGVTTAGKLTATLRTAAEVKWTLTVTNALAAGQWYDVKLVHNGTNPIIYIDREDWAQAFSVTTDETVWLSGLSNIDLARIGSLNVNSAGEADGFVGDIAYFELADDLDCDRTEIVKYLCDELTGTTLSDVSGNSLDGTFGSAGAAPTWGDAIDPIVLTGDTTNPGNLWFTAPVPMTALYIKTTATGQTAYIMEGF